MVIYVNGKALHDGNGSKERPFRHIQEAARIAAPGDEVLVARGTRCWSHRECTGNM